MLFIFSACGINTGEEGYIDDTIYESDAGEEVSSNDVIYEDESEYEDENEIDTAEALQELAEFAAPLFAWLEAMWDEDDGEMWGLPLNSPVIFFCSETDAVVANRPDREGEFVKQYIDGVPVYAGIRRMMLSPYIHRRDWSGATGNLVSMQHIQSGTFFDFGGAKDLNTAVVGAILHNTIHAIQPDLMGTRDFGVGTGAPITSTSDEARISYILEINALVNAINAEDEERFESVHHALSIRADRRNAFSDRTTLAGVSVTGAENTLQIIEGTAVYTQLLMPLTREEAIIAAQAFAGLLMEQSSFDVSVNYGYLGGALYGMLLDVFGASWRPYVWHDTDLGLMLQEALGITEFIPLDEIDLENYGYSEIVSR